MALHSSNALDKLANHVFFSYFMRTSVVCAQTVQFIIVTLLINVINACGDSLFSLLSLEAMLTKVS